MPRMIRNEIDIVLTVQVDSFERIADGRRHTRMRSDINDCVYINVETPVYVL